MGPLRKVLLAAAALLPAVLGGPAAWPTAELGEEVRSEREAAPSRAPVPAGEPEALERVRAFLTEGNLRYLALAAAIGAVGVLVGRRSRS